MRKAQRARDVLREIPIDDLIARVGKAGELYMNATLPMGDGTQSPDEFARAPHGVAQAERLLLTGEARAAGARQIVVEALKFACLAAGGEHLLELKLPVEVVLDHALVAAGDEDEMLDAGFHRFVDHMLDQWAVDHGQHLLRHGLGRRQETGAKPRHGEHRLADASSHADPR